MTSPRKLSAEELEAAFDAFTTAAPRFHHLRALRAHIAALESEARAEDRAHIRTLEERDAVQELFDELYVALFGQSPEYSNLFNATDAFNEMDARISGLKEQASAAYARGLEDAAGVASKHEDNYRAPLSEGLVDHGLQCKAAAASGIAAAIRALKEKTSE